MKKLLPTLLASAMVLSMSAVALAEDTVEAVTEDTAAIETEATEEEAEIEITEETTEEEVVEDETTEATEEEAVEEETTEVTEEEIVEEETTEVTEEEAAEVTEEEAIEEVVEETGLAAVTSNTVMVNGVEVAFDAYKIDGYNYFKLRDFAAAVTGTEGQFEVIWNEELQAINMVTGAAYTAVGGELEASAGVDQEFKACVSTVYIDEVEAELEAYEITDNNYFKLADLCAAFGISLAYDEETTVVTIESGAAIVEEEVAEEEIVEEEVAEEATEEEAVEEEVTEDDATEEVVEEEVTEDDATEEEVVADETEATDETEEEVVADETEATDAE